MPRGYGMGRGGYWRYHNRRYWGPPVPVDRISSEGPGEGAAYIGPCRCGYGPHAYYRTADGRVVHFSETRFEVAPPKQVSEPTKGELREELESLMSRVHELEQKLKEGPEAGKR